MAHLLLELLTAYYLIVTATVFASSFQVLSRNPAHLPVYLVAAALWPLFVPFHWAYREMKESQ